jgi:hypothetical protein
MDPGASGPNLDGYPSGSRLRRRAPAIEGSADRFGDRGSRLVVPDPPVKECGIAE